MEPGKERRIEGMRLVGIVGALCIVAAPALASPVVYTFDVTAGSVVLNIVGQGSTGGGLAGSFDMVIYQSDCHIGPSDTFQLTSAGLVSTSTMKLSLAGLATATLTPLSARFLDFAGVAGGPEAIGHVEPTPVEYPTDVYVEATVLVTGLTTTTFSTKTWAKSLLPFIVGIQNSAMRSDIFSVLVGGTFGYQVGIPDISLTITLDLIVNIEGTAHVVPDPALGGLTAMGLAGAGAWLRRRCS
jgi:hypothetical protein